MKKRTFFKRKTSGTLARERLRMLLMTDRISLSADLTEKIEKDIYQSISRYLEIEESGGVVQFEKNRNNLYGRDVTYICARFPVRNMSHRR